MKGIIQNMTAYGQLDALLSFLLANYLPGRDIKLTVCHNAQILRHYSTPDVELQALITPTGLNGWYVLYVAEGLKDPESVACHEFVHLTQLVSGRLCCNYSEGRFLWLGRTYTASMPYGSRPWELEAFCLQRKYMKRFHTRIRTNEKD